MLQQPRILRVSAADDQHKIIFRCSHVPYISSYVSHNPLVRGGCYHARPRAAEGNATLHNDSNVTFSHKAFSSEATLSRNNHCRDMIGSYCLFPQSQPRQLCCGAVIIASCRMWHWQSDTMMTYSFLPSRALALPEPPPLILFSTVRGSGERATKWTLPSPKLRGVQSSGCTMSSLWTAVIHHGPRVCRTRAAPICKLLAPARCDRRTTSARLESFFPCHS